MFFYLYLEILSFQTWLTYHHFFFLSLFVLKYFFSFFFFFSVTLCFGKKILFSIFYTLNIYHSTLDLFIPFFCFYLYSFVNKKSIIILHFFCKIIIQRLRKWCFTITIATLFHSFAMLKISLKSYIFLLMHMIFTIFYYM